MDFKERASENEDWTDWTAARCQEVDRLNWTDRTAARCQQADRLNWTDRTAARCKEAGRLNWTDRTAARCQAADRLNVANDLVDSIKFGEFFEYMRTVSCSRRTQFHRTG